MRRTVPSRSHQVEVEESDLRVLGDQRALGRLLANLLVNAVGYAPCPVQIGRMNFAESVATGHSRRHSVRVTKRLWLSMLVVLVSASTGCLTATSAEAATRAPAAGRRSVSTTFGASDFESWLLAKTNVRRARHGCRPLRSNAALTVAARLHSARMSAEDMLSHQLSDEAGLVPRIVGAGYTNWRLLAENLAWGQSTPAEVFHDWVHSPLHRANLDNCRLRDVGFGVVITGGRPWVTQDFGRRAS